MNRRERDYAVASRSASADVISDIAGSLATTFAAMAGVTLSVV
jgi:hypothetical protein